MNKLNDHELGQVSGGWNPYNKQYGWFEFEKSKLEKLKEKYPDFIFEYKHDTDGDKAVYYICGEKETASSYDDIVRVDSNAEEIAEEIWETLDKIKI